MVRDDRALELNKTPSLNHNEHLYIYAIARKDLNMNPGKLSAQIGHAFHFIVRCNKNTSLVEMYEDPSLGGSKVCLYAKNENQLLKTKDQLESIGIPCELVIDSNHVHPPFFDGNPIVTALGVGPCTKSQTQSILKKLELIK